jgi:8-oxo-dGTP diphosphatase
MNSAAVKVGVAVFIWKDGAFLMGKRLGTHGENTWSIPGGHIEPGETLEQAVARETLEETGLSIVQPRFLTYTEDIFENGKHYITMWFEADWHAGEPVVNEPDKWVEQTWVPVENMPSPLFEPCFANFKRALPNYLATS